MRNFDKDKLGVVNVQGKILPFKGAGAIETVNTDESTEIVKAIKQLAKKYKSIVVDDYQYVMANEFMRRAAERGYDKFTEIARHAWDIADCVRELPQDVIVYIMCHTDTDNEGTERLKTIGKLLDEKICLEGMSTIVLKTNVSDGQYTFLTQNNGKDTVKSPAGMFSSYAIDNDLHYVDNKIRNYYELGEFLTDEEMAELDEEVKKDNVPFTGGKTSRRSRRAAEADSNNNSTEEKPENVESTKDSVGERPKRTRRKSTDNEAEIEAVKARNAEAVANNGVSEGSDEPKNFDEVETPELEPVPRRKRRTAETPEAEAKPQIMTPPAEDTAETETADATPTRRRRRRV